MDVSNLIVVSNRLPVSIGRARGTLRVRRSAGGLATALSGVSGGDDALWVGWSGAAVDDDAERSEVERLLEPEGLVPVHLDAREVELYYHGFSNAALWPVFHYFTSMMDFDDEAWRCYVAVNRKFAQRVAERAPEGATVWLHDFHLMLVPAALRSMRPDLRIGFFLHIPFPSSEVYRVLPCRAELLRGVLGADYISFHTHDYASHFRSACLRVLGADSTPKRVAFEGRSVGVGVDPIGVDVERFRDLLDADDTLAAFADLQNRYQGRRLLLGVERLDYTKGVLVKLRAYERFLAQDPTRAQDVAFLQIIVPSRLEHRDYRELKREIEEEIGRINGAYGAPGVTPIEYMHRSVPDEELVALYRFADVGWVTPLRDGMNLVAQEYVLCQAMVGDRLPLGAGVLILSEFAGAAHSLSQSLLVNPHDVEQISHTLGAALAMGRGERQERMAHMARSVVHLDCRRWAARFLTRLDDSTTASVPPKQPALDVEALRQEFLGAPQRVLLLDYDGTLRELAARPEEAAPTDEIMALLADLASLPDTEVHLVSGRLRADLEEWFGHLGVHLCAEHGALRRAPGAKWRLREGVELGWMDGVRELLHDVTRDVPGTFIEEKTCGLTWHYRLANPDYGPWRARELMSLLDGYLANEKAEVIRGNRVVEVRALGVSKGEYAEVALRRARPGCFVLAIGDDRTDLDLYRELPGGSRSIHVGAPVAEARHAIASPARVRALLRGLVDAATHAPA